MSEENGKVCCNCRNCIRTKDDNGYINCTCKFFNGFMGYLQVMEGWCRHWAREREWDNEQATGKEEVNPQAKQDRF